MTDQNEIEVSVTGLPDPAKILLAKPGVAEELISGELFLYDRANNGAVHCLNSGAAMIWFLCDGTHNIAAIASEIAEIAKLPEHQILVEVQETVAQFKALALLEP
jgi:hypothetical protein